MTEIQASHSQATRLLISVRNAVEASLAVSAGVPMIDVKEPLQGSLGSADSDTWQEVLEEVAGRSTVSAALGELLEYEVQSLPEKLSLAKFGLAGCRDRQDWPHLWRQAIATFPGSMQPVAVIYADHERAHAPRPVEVIGVGRELGCKFILVDTFDKSQGSLLDQWTWIEIQRMVEQVNSQDLNMVLAGSLSVSDIRRLLPLKPAVVAVRGAACGGDRNGTLCPNRVNELVSLVEGNSTSSRSQASFVTS